MHPCLSLFSADVPVSEQLLNAYLLPAICVRYYHTDSGILLRPQVTKHPFGRDKFHIKNVTTITALATRRSPGSWGGNG